MPDTTNSVCVISLNPHKHPMEASWSPLVCKWGSLSSERLSPLSEVTQPASNKMGSGVYTVPMLVLSLLLLEDSCFLFTKQSISAMLGIVACNHISKYKWCKHAWQKLSFFSCKSDRWHTPWCHQVPKFFLTVIYKLFHCDLHSSALKMIARAPTITSPIQTRRKCESSDKDMSVSSDCLLCKGAFLEDAPNTFHIRVIRQRLSHDSPTCK